MRDLLKTFISVNEIYNGILEVFPTQGKISWKLQSGASGERLGWVELDLGCSTILLGQ